MLFTLEALEAAHGDCLLLHYGTPQAPRTIIIDGGPSGVYIHRLEPRLKELQQTRSPGQPLPIPLLVVSHIDEDHILGILDLTRELIRAGDDGDLPLVRVQQLWHNSFDDIVKPVPAAVAEVDTAVKAAAASQPLPPHFQNIQADTLAVIASVGQGRTLRADAQRLAIVVNSGFIDAQIIAPRGSVLSKNAGAGLTLTIVGPRQEQFDALQNDWAKKIADKKKKGTLKPAEVMEAAAAEFVDESVYNLSSIVILAECGGKSMLLTGDGRGDYVIQALEESGLKKKGKPLSVDVVKVPHHGSWRNLDDQFFEEVVGEHYVFSANGRDGNPDKPSLESLLRTRPKGGYTVYLTNHRNHKTGRKLPAATFLDKNAKGKKVKVVYAKPDEAIPKIVIDLGQPLGN